MSEQEEATGKMRITERGGMGRFKRFLVVSLILAVLLLGTFAVVIGYTEGGHIWMEDWLGGRLGMKLKVAKTRVAFPGAVVFEDVEAEEFKCDGEAGFKAEEIRVGLGFKPWYRVSAKRAVLYLVETQKDAWEPAVFVRLANLPRRNVADISRVTEEFREKMTLDISESSLYWCPLGAERAQVRRFSFKLRPAKVDAEKMYYHFLSADNVVGIDGAKVPDLERKWLGSKDNPYVEISRAGSPIPLSAKIFWEPVTNGK